MLTELLVAMVIFGIIAGGLAAMSISMLKKTGNTRSDSTASQLLTKDLDIVRAIGAANLPKDTSQVLVNTAVVGGLTYKVYREVDDYAPGGGSCGVTARPSKRVTTIVKWTEALGGNKVDDFGNVTLDTKGTQSITGTTILTPLPDSLIDGKGSYGVVVKDQDGNGLEGISVTYTTGAAGTTGTTMTTNSEGCTLLSNLTAGATYTAWLGGNPTYVPLGYRHGADATIISASNTIAANTASKSEFVYGKAAQITLTPSTDTAHPVPANLPFTVFNSQFPTSTQTFSTTAGTTTSPGSMYVLAGPVSLTSSVFPYLFPSTLGYTPWLGSCPDSDPSTSGGSRGSAVSVRPGGAYNGTVPVAKVDLNLTNLVVATDMSITITHDNTVTPSAPCSPNPSYNLAPSNLTALKPTGTSQVVRFAMPYGAWKVTVTQGAKVKTVTGIWNGSVGATTQTLNLSML